MLTFSRIVVLLDDYFRIKRSIAHLYELALWSSWDGTENAWPGPHSSKVLKPFLSSISAIPQNQFIPARYAMYVSPGKS